MAGRSQVSPLRIDASASLAGIDANSPTPLYHQIFSLLRDRIYDGEFPGGAFLPGEQELATHFNVSRITAKRALDEIAAAGLAVREQGRGTRVCITPRSTFVRGGVEGLIHSLHANGRGSVQLLEFEYLPATKEIAEKLGIMDGSEVQRAVRVWHGKEGPFSYLTTYVPGAIGRRWTRKDLEKKPLISLLQTCGVTVSRADEQITAVIADELIASRLEIGFGAPLLKITRTVFDDNDTSVEYLVAFYPPDRYQYSVSLGA